MTMPTTEKKPVTTANPDNVEVRLAGVGGHGAGALGRSPAGPAGGVLWRQGASVVGGCGGRPGPRTRFRAGDQTGTESLCSQACQAGSSRRRYSAASAENRYARTPAVAVPFPQPYT